MRNHKQLLSLLVFASLMLIAGGSVEETIYIFLFLMVLAAVIIFVGLYSGIRDASEKERKQKEEEEEVRLKREENKKRFYNWIQNLEATYGKADKIINWSYMIKSSFITFGSKGIVIINANKYLMKDIISYEVIDDQRIRKGKTTYTTQTKTSNGSAIGRALVGGVLAGGTGAVIGAATGKKNSTTIATTEADEISHKYTINVNINDLKTPIVSIEFFRDTYRETEYVQEISALLNIIIKRNKG